MIVVLMQEHLERAVGECKLTRRPPISRNSHRGGLCVVRTGQFVGGEIGPTARCWSSLLFLSFFHGKLVLSVALSTTDRQASRLAASLQAEHRPVFKGLESDSTTRNHVCLGRPTSRLQSGGGFRIAAETACMGEMCTMWPKNRSLLSVTIYESGRQLGTLNSTIPYH